MATFRVNVPVESTDPRITVENRLDAGLHRFQLVVVGRNGQRSAPDVAVVQVPPAPNR